MELRKYLETDANEIIKWNKDEKALRLWSADRYGDYPITANDINTNYSECINAGNFYPMTLVDGNQIVGHIILRNPSPDMPNVVRLGFIIVDTNLRGKGYGKTLINEAIKYAKEHLHATEINLGVFVNNKSAINCYKAVGFKEIGIEKNAFTYNTEIWDCIEMILDNL